MAKVRILEFNSKLESIETKNIHLYKKLVDVAKLRHAEEVRVKKGAPWEIAHSQMNGF